MKLKFIGASETVTGSKHLIITEKGCQVLLDCGLYQGLGDDTDEMNRDLELDAKSIDAVILSHGHIDHCGNLPYLVKQGFRGKIYCTPPTKDVAAVLLKDSAQIQKSDAEFMNKKKRRKSATPLQPLYTLEDAEKCLTLFETVDFHTDLRLNDEISFYFTENGHLTGSAAVSISVKENNDVKRLVFTGDIGRYSDPILKPPAIFQQADYIICESTYGDRLHGSREDIEKKLLNIINTTCIQKKGKLIVPAFSLGRTQEIIYILDKLANKKLLPDIPIYVDGPMSVKATAIVRKHTASFNDELLNYIRKDPDPFGFPNLTYIEESSESRQLNDMEEPCVIISSSGMADAGRIQHHLCYNIADEKNTILLTGYCSPGSLGGKLLRGDKQVRIFDFLFDVNAEIRSLQSLSAHADYDEIIRFLSCQSKKLIKKLFLVHGEAETKIVFKERLIEAGYLDVVIPAKNEIIDLSGSQQENMVAHVLLAS